MRWLHRFASALLFCGLMFRSGTYFNAALQVDGAEQFALYFLAVGLISLSTLINIFQDEQTKEYNNAKNR